MRNATEYILMNKDVPYALFSCAQDEFGEESAILREWYTDLRPIRSRRGLRSAERPNDANIWSSFSSSTAVSVWRAFCV